MIKKINVVFYTYMVLILGTIGIASMFLLDHGKTAERATEDINVLRDLVHDNNISNVPVALADKVPITHTVTFLDYEGNVDFSIDVEHGETVGYIPDSEWEDGILDYWTHSITGERLRKDTPIFEDVVYTPNYIYIEWLITNALGGAGLTIEDIDVSSFSEVINYIEKVQRTE